MTLRKTLIGALAALLLFAGFSGRAQAQDTDTTTDTTTTATTTPDTTTDDTTPTDTTAADTTPTDTTTTTTTAADTTAADTTTPDTGNAALAESFGDETPNPQPSEPLPAAEAAPENAALATEPAPAAEAAPAAAGEVQLAFTGPDTRVMALGALLLGAGAIFLVVSRSQRQRLEFAETWVE